MNFTRFSRICLFPPQFRHLGDNLLHGGVAGFSAILENMSLDQIGLLNTLYSQLNVVRLSRENTFGIS